MKRYKILVIPPFFPFPPNDGGKICVFGFIDYLRKYHEFHLFVPIRTDEEKLQLHRLESIWDDVTIHVVDETIKRTKKTELKKTFKRWPFIQLAEFVKKNIARLDKPVNRDPYRFYNNILNTFPFTPFSFSYVNELTRILRFHNFDIIQSELTPMLNLVHLFPLKARKIFVQIEFREDVLKDYGQNSGIDKHYSEYITSNAGFIEYSYMSLYDAVFTLNENDRKVISDKCPGIQVYNSPFAILAHQVAKVETQSYQPLHLLFMGGENHFPNYDGVKWFLTEGIPQLKIDPPLLYVTGTWQETTKNEFLRYYKKIEFTGFVEDLTTYLNNSINIVPIRIGGGGMRTKVLFAMANNSPVVTTSIASVGIDGKENIDFLIGDTAEEFAEGISRIMLNPSIGKEIIQNAQKLISSTYSQKIVSEKRNDYYHKIMES